MNRARILRMLKEKNSCLKSQPEAETKPKVLGSNQESPSNDVAINGTFQANRPALATIPETNHVENGLEQNGLKPPTTEEDNHEMFDMWDPMAEDYHSGENTLALNPDKDPECVVTGKMVEEGIMIGGHRVCEFYLKHGTCADGKYCTRLHVHPSARDRIIDLQKDCEKKTSTTRMISSYLSPIDLNPNDNTLLLVSITMITSPTKFYFVAPYEQMNFAALTQDEIDFYIGRVQQSSSIKTKLLKCHEQLSYLFNHNYRIDNPKDVLCISQMVACKLDDGRFCRAMVLDNRNRDDIGSYYKLLLLDIGTEVYLERERIYEIRASCLSEPPMAISGRLELRPANGDLHWSPEARSLFGEFATENKYVLCRVKSRKPDDDLFTVDLFSIKDRTSITDLMLDRNLAERMTI